MKIIGPKAVPGVVRPSAAPVAVDEVTRRAALAENAMAAAATATRCLILINYWMLPCQTAPIKDLKHPNVNRDVNNFSES
jgi:hypothetical protein